MARFLEPKTQCVAEPGLGARVMDRGGSDRTTTGAKSGIVINQKQTKKKTKTTIIIKIKNNPSQKKCTTQVRAGAASVGLPQFLKN